VQKGDDGILYVNPGEVGGWLKGRHTVALIDTEKLEATVEDIPMEGA
jgi:predicted phosphodiesterase